MPHTPSDPPSSLGKAVIRVAAVQYQLRQISSFDEFAQQCEYFTRLSSEYRCDFVTFPELFTLQLLSLEEAELPANLAVERLSTYTPRLTEMFADFARRYQVNIIAGSHLTRLNQRNENISLVFLRDGSILHQGKIHPTPNERRIWEIEGVDHLSAIESDCGSIGVLICYDNEFPELARRLVDQGVEIIFAPFCTDDRQGYLRVRYCAQARAVENQVYVVLAGNVGNLRGVQNMAIHYAQSGIFTPCDYGFARDGIAAEAAVNNEAIIMADLPLAPLRHARKQGTVQNLGDRRHDLYAVAWYK